MIALYNIHYTHKFLKLLQIHVTKVIVLLHLCGIQYLIFRRK